jgi:hypothetical protein
MARLKCVLLEVASVAAPLGDEIRLLVCPQGEPNLLRKASQLINAPYAGLITQNDAKIWHFLLHRVYSQIGRSPVHEVDVAEILAFVGHGSHQRIHESLERLSKAEISIDWVDERGLAHSLRAHYLSYDMIHAADGTIRFSFDPFALDLLTNPRVFAYLSIASLRKFRSLYATKLYEIMALRERRHNKVWEPDLTEFRVSMGITDGYQRFDNLCRRVIMPAVDEVNEIAPFGVVFDLVRSGHGGKVAKLKFTTIPRDKRTLMDITPTPTRRPTRNDLVPDLFDGRTDNDRRRAVSNAALTRAKEMMGEHGDPLAEIEKWRTEMAGRRIISPDRSFLGWLAIKQAREQDEHDLLAKLAPDAISGFLTDWENKGA